MQIPDNQEVGWVWLLPEKWSTDQVVVQCWNRLTWVHVAKLHEWRLVLGFQNKGETKVTLQHGYLGFLEWKNAYSRKVVVFFVLFPIVIYKNTAHAKVRRDGWMLFLWRLSEQNKRAISRHTEYSQSTKLDVSRKLRSLVLRRVSPTFPPLPIFRPDLSFFFLAVRTLEKWSSILEGNWRAGRWKDLASCLESLVLYWKNMSNRVVVI